jgi:hypothetical protein
MKLPVSDAALDTVFVGVSTKMYMGYAHSLEMVGTTGS